MTETNATNGTNATDSTTANTTGTGTAGDISGTDTTTGATGTDTQTQSTTQNDPAKNKRLAYLTMSEQLRSLFSFEMTLPGIYKGMHTNQFLWMDVADDFYDDFYSDIMENIGETKFNRYTGFKAGRFYIEKKEWKYDLKDGVKTTLTLNPIPSMYSEYMKDQLEAERALDQAVIDATGGGGGGTSTSTSEGGALGNNALEVGNALASKYQFCSGAAQSYAAMKKSGCGSCWAWSGALYTELKKIGVTVRVIEYVTSQANNHESVQYKDQNGNWVDYPYRSTNIPRNARNTPRKPGCHVVLDENGNGKTEIL